MPFETGTTAPKTIAVIGAGISGMGAAYMLAERHRVVLFEAETRLGGHARTRMAGQHGDQTVDTGFIVFNYANYPHLTALFDALGVPVRKSSMSFGVSIDGGRMEYALNSLDSIVAQRSNLARPGFVRMLRDILRFNKHALAMVRDEPDLSVGDLIGRLGLGRWFRDYYLLPFSGAIWSTPKEQIMDFPAQAMLRFFDNHALLAYTGQHQWYTVEGGSRSYVSRLGTAMERRGVDIRLGAPIGAVRRGPMGVEVKVSGCDWELYDEVVFATHSDDTLRLLSDATAVEQSVLGAIRYQPNSVVLHSDSSIMPKRKKVWASWVYTEQAGKTTDRIDVSYWMNSLQPWLTDDPLFVTLNSTRPIREELIWDETEMRHPVYDLGAMAAQEAAAAMNGSNRTWFCGAWMKNGFHEDGLASAVDVVEALNAQPALSVAAE